MLHPVTSRCPYPGMLFLMFRGKYPSFVGNISQFWGSSTHKLLSVHGFGSHKRTQSCYCASLYGISAQLHLLVHKISFSFPLTNICDVWKYNWIWAYTLTIHIRMNVYVRYIEWIRNFFLYGTVQNLYLYNMVAFYFGIIHRVLVFYSSNCKYSTI